MTTSVVMTVIGPDRPGLVDSVAEIVEAHEGNWLESRMSRLGGQFAGILRVELPSEKESALAKSLQSLDAKGLTVVVHEDSRKSAGGGALRVLEIVGHDRPGIVKQISHALARHGVNMEELSSEVASAAMSGELLFKAQARILLPEGCDVNALQQELEEIAADLIVELSFSKTGG